MNQSPYLVGPPVATPDGFFGRRRQTDRVFNMLRSGTLQPLCVRGLRRSGKTSFLGHIANRGIIERELPNAQSTIVAYVDLLLEINSPSDFFLEVAESVARAVPTGIQPTVPESFSTSRQFRKWIEFVLASIPNSRIIILLDEFELLSESAAFERSFFEFLRALAGPTLNLRLTWITASLRDLYTLSQGLGEQYKASPFFNIFHPTPVIIGGLEQNEAIQLICEPAQRGGIQFDAQEIETINNISGDLPYFLQATAEKWFLNKKNEPTISVTQNFNKTIEQLLIEPSNIPQQIRHYWEHFTESEQASLRQALQGKLKAVKDHFVEHVATQFGLMHEKNGFYLLSGEIFIRWILANDITAERAASFAPAESNVLTDIIIMTALPEELEAVLNNMPEYYKLPPSNDDIRIYYRAVLEATLTDGSTKSYNIIVFCLLGMGRVQAAIATADAIRKWRSPYIILVGIAGGIANNGINIGDVLIADQIIDYELQKVTTAGPQIRYDVYRADPRLLNAYRNFRTVKAREPLEINRPASGTLNHHFGPIVSGDKVIAVNTILALYQSDWPRLIGVEMEAAGVATAAFQSSAQPGFFMIRGVSDLADENKDALDTYKWRSYACNAAAFYTIAFLKSGPIPLRC